MLSNFVAKFVSPYLKAHASALASALALLVSDLSSQNGGLNALTSNQWWAIVAAAGISFGAVHTVANTSVVTDAANDVSAAVASVADDGLAVSE